ncbi:phytoene desaturase family protein [Salipaludibacillus aurantiacus]|uniref:Phytoene desaturase n=1 Tax=Salipaludibacillus aurantiacus TaxID=1601833 RepID=A0A1H9PG69_9BACI|nr:phytoene desaturase family protein [Salipaludibacillus aurantiacus]SER47212.1 phytoene desaturase [Salipaludibacillus aurantiacus]
MKTAIIGGGIGGMVSALYLQQKGENVTVYERHNKLGGRLAFMERDGYRIDEGPTIVLLPHMIKDILKELSIDLSKLEMVKIDPIYPLHFKDGKKLLKWSDKHKQAEEIERLFPGESDHFHEYMDSMRERFEKGKEAFLDRPFVNRRSFWTKNNIKTLMKLKAYQTVRSQTKKFFKSKQLQEAFSLQTLYIGGSPEQTPAIYSLVPFSEHEHGIWYIKGGYAYLAELLEEELANRGINIEYKTEVERIETAENRATSLSVNGKNFTFDRFILNGDFPVAEKLLQKKSGRAYTPSVGTLLIYLGIEGMLTTSHVHQFFMGEELDSQMKEIFVKKALPSDPSFYLFNPSLIDASLAPPGKSAAYLLIPVPASGEITREEYLTYADRIIDQLSKRLDTGLKEKIIWKEVRTPIEAKRDGLFDGGSFGIAPTLFQSGVFRPQLKPFEYENIYAVGASVHPGGGVPIVMQGAKILSQFIDEEQRGSDQEYNQG